jgi:CxxC motif-containing protein (DUF1111 family)
MTTRKRIYLAIAIITLIGLGNVLAQTQFKDQRSRAPRQHHDVALPTTAATQFGDPLADLTPTQLADFAAGLDEFQSVDTAESGLGPVFNNVSCVACHSDPAIGGGSVILETRFGRIANGHFDPLVELGGSLMQDFAIDPTAQEVVPAQANVVAKRKSTPLFGLGLIEAIPDSAILQNAQSPKPDGITGRPSIVQDVATGHTRIGRFGWKAQQATLLAFAGDAYLNEIGITSRLFPQENAPRGDPYMLELYDHVADPEDAVDPATGKADIDRFADFMRYLAPPPRASLTLSAIAGAAVFLQTGCENCHRALMQTSSSTIRALDRKLVPLFSDLLLHDMGSLGDGIAQGTAAPAEMKTAPLRGLRARTPLLHDGRAPTIDAAIRLHDGEAARVRDRYTRLNSAQQQQLLDFLKSI